MVACYIHVLLLKKGGVYCNSKIDNNTIHIFIHEQNS